MAEIDYKTLKTRIEELIENVDKVGQEAASFSAAKSELVMIAKNMQEISSDLSTAIKTSEAVLDQINSIAVSSTLEAMKGFADRFDKTSENHIGSLSSEFRGSANRTSTKLDAIKEEILSSARATYEKQTKELQKRMYIIGGVAIIVSIVALICAFV